MPRMQKLVAIQRKKDSMYWCNTPGATDPSWTDKLENANVVSEHRVTGLIRATWGRDIHEFEIIPVVPARE